MERNDDHLLGKLAVLRGFCTREQVDECLRLQAGARTPAPLSDLLLFKGYLTEPQLASLSTRQERKAMRCPACALSFTVLTRTGGASAKCPRCGGLLQDRGPGPMSDPDAEIATRPMRVVPPSAGPTTSLDCPICEHAFEAAVEPAGRVRCPGCHSTFTPRMPG